MTLPRSRFIRAFSLAEVTLSTGIIATVLLPLIAMLAGSSSTENATRDRETASRIAFEITQSIRRTQSGEFELSLDEFSSISIQPPTANAEASRFFLLDANGQYQGQASSSDYSSGAASNPEALYLVRIDLKRSAVSQSEQSGKGSPFDLTLKIEAPARAAEASRNRQTFRTRIAAP